MALSCLNTSGYNLENLIASQLLREVFIAVGENPLMSYKLVS